MELAIEKHSPSPLELIQETLRSGGSAQEMAAVIKELVALQQAQERFTWEREERQAKIDFDEALNRCQSSVGRIAPNVHRDDTRSWWADYTQLDRALRPIYTNEGFSIGYSEVEPIHEQKVRIKGTLSRGGVSRDYFSEITPSTTGPKGGAMATATDADAIAASRAKRYILISIFNVAVGIDKEEKKLTEKDEASLQEHLDAMRQTPDIEALKEVFRDAFKFGKATGQEDAITKVYEEMKKKFGGQR